MKFFERVFQIGLSICVLLVAGCGNTSFPFGEKLDSTAQAETRPTPFAVLTIAPSQNWFGNIEALMTNRTEVTSVSDEKLQKILAGIDVHRPTAAMLYLSDKGLPEPVIFVPVVDYEGFLDELDRRFRLKRAFACSFRIGQYRFLVKQVGDYAAIGTSVDGINSGPQSPEPYLQEMPKSCDFALQLRIKSLRKHEKKNLFSAVRDSLGETIATMVHQTDSLVFGLTLDSTKEIGLQAQFDPAPANPLEIQQMVQDVFATQGWISSTEIKEDHLTLDIDVPSPQIKSVWVQIKPTLESAFKSQLKSLAQRASRHGSYGMMKIVESESASYLPDCSSAAGSGGGSGGRRRGRG